MSSIDSNLNCPSCKAQMEPLVLGCQNCNIRMEGPFHFNEFASMSPEDLHFLRIFIRCEGRIRDMEPALGLSYPTIRTRLADLKNKLSGEEPETKKPQDKSEQKTRDILSQLEKGEISFDEAMKKIKKARS
jgi:hypothetical protein